MPIGWSFESIDFINKVIIVFLVKLFYLKLLQRKPHHRLGYNGPQEVKSHAWFKNFPWDKLLSMELTAGFIPRVDWYLLFWFLILEYWW